VKALVLRTSPGDLQLEDVATGPVGPHEVRVRTAAAGLCHSDVHAIDGNLPTQVPTVMGHEAAGEVLEIGSDVTEVQVGDHVVACLSAFCGSCPACMAGRPYICRAAPNSRAIHPSYRSGGSAVGQYQGIGGFAEEMVLHQRSVVRVPKELPFPPAAVLGCAVVTGVGAVCNTAEVPLGASVAVIGCGGVGLNCVQGAVLAGAARIVAVDIDRAKLELAEHFGATDLMSGSDPDVAWRIRKMTGGGVEFSFEAVGSPDTASIAIAALRPGGTATIAGLAPPTGDLAVGLQDLVTRGKRIQGSIMGSTRSRIDIPSYAALYLSGRLKLDELVTAQLAMSEVPAALAHLRSGGSARSVLVFDT
jgi:S-(hydroxymethyl)glutathione dehydrogenase / alcohol dehydrogenase